MCWCSRKKASPSLRKKYYVEYKDLPDYVLHRKIKKLQKKQNREYCFGGLYTTTAIGSTIATVISPVSAVASIPTALVSVVATLDNISKSIEYENKLSDINNILKERQYNEICIKHNIHFPVISSIDEQRN